ncbi:hypothetical protein [Sphingomonas glacialis]|nr:hypothetical protein [Sphingomonas glacialis]
MTYKFPLAFTALLLIAGLGACSQSSEAPSHGDNYFDTRTEPTDEVTPVAPETRAPDPEPTPTADTNTTAAVPEKAPAAAPDEQLMDDASATGMTARTTRGDQTNQAAPAEQTENN